MENLGSCTSASVKMTSLGGDVSSAQIRPTIDDEVSSKFAAYVKQKEESGNSSCQGVCNCESIIGDGNGAELTEDQVKEILSNIEKMDIDSVKYKLMNPDSGKPMTREQADIAGIWYKRFLALVIKYPKKYVVPHSIVDEVWHTHILDTRKYADDCEKTFGFFLHHFPFFGMRSNSDFDHFMAAGEDSANLYIENYGESVEMLERAFLV